MVIIMLLDAKADDPWYKKLGIWLYCWLLWLVPAFADTISDDIGGYYWFPLAMQVMLTLILVLGVPVALTLQIGAPWWLSVLAEFAIYLISGLLYHWRERRWNM